MNTLKTKTIYVVMVKMNIKSDISIFNTFLNYKQFTHLLHFPHHSLHIKQLLFNTLYIILFYKFSLAALHPIKN